MFVRCSFRNVVSYYKQGISISRLGVYNAQRVLHDVYNDSACGRGFLFLRVLNSINSTRASLSLSLSLSPHFFTFQ